MANRIRRTPYVNQYYDPNNAWSGGGSPVNTSVVNGLYSQIQWPQNMPATVNRATGTSGASYQEKYGYTPENHAKDTANAQALKYQSFSAGLGRLVTDTYSRYNGAQADILLKAYDVQDVFNRIAFRPHPDNVGHGRPGNSIENPNLPGADTVTNSGHYSRTANKSVLPSTRGQITPKQPGTYSGPRDIRAEVEWMRHNPTYSVHGALVGPDGFTYSRGAQQLANNPDHDWWVKGGTDSWFEVRPENPNDLKNTTWRYANVNNLPAGNDTPGEKARLMDIGRARGEIKNFKTGQTSAGTPIIQKKPGIGAEGVQDMPSAKTVFTIGADGRSTGQLGSFTESVQRTQFKDSSYKSVDLHPTVRSTVDKILDERNKKGADIQPWTGTGGWNESGTVISTERPDGTLGSFTGYQAVNYDISKIYNSSNTSSFTTPRVSIGTRVTY